MSMLHIATFACWNNGHSSAQGLKLMQIQAVHFVKRVRGCVRRH